MKATLVLLLCIVAVAFAAQTKVLATRNGRNHPKDWQVGSPAAPNHQLTFLVALKQRNLDILEEKFWAVSDPDSPQYRNFLTIGEISAIVDPAPEVKQRVIDWLNAHDVSAIKDHGDALEVKASVASAEKLFKTHFVKYTNVKTKRTIVRHLGRLVVPSHVSEYIDLVSGLSEFPVSKYAVKRSRAPQTLVSVAPQTVGIFYNIPSGVAVTRNSSAGVIEFVDQYFSPDDLKTFATQFNVPIPAITPDHIVGSNDPSNPQVEADLDIQWVLGIGLKATGWFWIEADNVWLYGFGVHMFNTQNVPLVNSISYGWNEEDQCEDGIGGQECQQLGVDSKQYVQRVNVQFQKIGLRGISLISASGDSGANGRTDPDCSENHLNPPYPAASPYITSVGGTQIDQSSGVANLPNPPPGCSGQNCGSGGTEEAVSYDQANYASGGGFSYVAAQPAYQATAVNAYLNSGVQLPPASYFNASGRGFPDVAGLGSQVLIVDGGSIEPVGGTSCASPIVAGIVSLLNDRAIQKTGKPLGFLNPLFYKMAAESPNCFQDITKGDNICTEDGCSANCKGYYCTKGWDPVTGLGTLNYGNMLSYLNNQIFNKAK
jgi:tripeptidyl-peptidase-1